MSTFYAVVHRTSDDRFSVRFPDCPDCTAIGTTFAEAELLAAEALQRHLEALDAAGAALPRPSTVSVIKRDPAHQGGVVIAVPVTARLARAMPARLRSSVAAPRPRRKAAPPAA